MTESQSRAAPDLKFKGIPNLSWEPEERVASLETMASYVAEQAELAITWYLGKIPRKRYFARLLRLTAILATTVSGLIPLLAEIFVTNGIPDVQPAWASVALAIAGAAVLLDHFFGFSSAWMRYFTTKLRIERALHDFRFEWEIHGVVPKNKKPESDEVKEVQGKLECCKRFIARIDEIIAEETEAWIREFRAALLQIETTKIRT